MDNLKVKYAVMEVKDDKGYDEYTKEAKIKDVVVAYIVSKCYIISETMDYVKDKITYEVVFPYDRIGISRRFKKSDNIDLQNTVVVDETFNSYDEALKVADEKNASKDEREVERYYVIAKELDVQNGDMVIENNDLDFNRIIAKKFYTEVASILSTEEFD